MRMASFVAFCLLMALGGCSAPSAVGTEQGGEVSIQFALNNGSEPADCHHDLPDLGSGHLSASLRDARLYVSDVRLIDASGKEVPLQLRPSDWQYADVTLLDFEDATGHCKSGTAGTNSQVVGSVPPGRYTGLTFTVGVPEKLNHTSTETSPAPLDLAAMGWSWQAGRKFMKIEVDPQGGVTLPSGRVAQSWFVHLGSTGCVGNPAGNEAVSCSHDNRVPVRFPSFNLQKQKVVLDLKQLFAASDLSHDGGGAVGCMSGTDDPECPGIFERLGLKLNDSTPGAGDAGKPMAADGRSDIFRVGAKP